MGVRSVLQVVKVSSSKRTQKADSATGLPAVSWKEHKPFQDVGSPLGAKWLEKSWRAAFSFLFLPPSPPQIVTVGFLWLSEGAGAWERLRLPTLLDYLLNILFSRPNERHMGSSGPGHQGEVRRWEEVWPFLCSACPGKPFRCGRRDGDEDEAEAEAGARVI